MKGILKECMITSMKTSMLHELNTYRSPPNVILTTSNVDLLFSHLKALQAKLKHDKASNVIVCYNAYFTDKENFELEN